MQRSILSISGVLVLGLILVLSNSIISSLFGRFYFDLTADKLFTLSAGSRNILAGLNEDIILKYYVSKTDSTKYPAIKMYGERVTELLRQYERFGKGKITLEIYDPRPDTEEESWAQKYGLTPLGLPTGEKLFFGLAAINGRGSEEVIPAFNFARQEFLEYDISKLIYSLNIESKPVVAVLSSLNIQGEQQGFNPMFGNRQRSADPWVFISQLANFAELKFLPSDTKEIEEGISELLLIHPKNLSQQTLYAIDQFVMRGGKLFVAIDPFCQADQPPPDPRNPAAGMFADRSSNVKELLTAWGVELIEKKVVADISLSTKVATGEGSAPVDFVLWLSLNKASNTAQEVINNSDLLTGQLENVLFPWSGALKISPLEDVKVEPLFKTTTDAMLVEENAVKFGGGQPEELMTKYVKGGQSYVLAARISGRLKSNFKEPPKEESSTEQKDQSSTAKSTHLNESKGIAHVVVVADADFLSDPVSASVQRMFGTKLVTLLNDNLNFAANVVENLLGNDDLISLRSRGQFTRPFTKVQEIERKAQERWRDQEAMLVNQLNAANERLSQLQSTNSAEEGKKGEQIFNKALLDEVKKFRDQRQMAQQNLREVRLKLRQDKERLGNILFMINAFFVPFLLIALTIVWYRVKAKKPLGG